MKLLRKLVYRFVTIVSFGFLIDFLMGDFYSYMKFNFAFAAIAVSIEGLYGLYGMKKKKFHNKIKLT